MVTCQACGLENKDGAVDCARCGYSLEPDGPGSTAGWRLTLNSSMLSDETHPTEWTVDGRGWPGDPPAGSSSHMRSEGYRQNTTSSTYIGYALADPRIRTGVQMED